MSTSLPVGLVLAPDRFEALQRMDSGTAQSRKNEELKQVALSFEEIMVRQLLQPMEKSLTRSMGGNSGSPMVGGMIINSLSQSIAQGGGLGLASVIEEALRDVSPDSVSPGETSHTQSEKSPR